MEIDVNPWVAKLAAYVPGEQPRDAGWVKLNTNENPYPPPPQVLEAIQAAASEMKKYPDPLSSELREAIASRSGVSASQVLAGNGSDEVLRLICHAFLRADRGDRIGV